MKKRLWLIMALLFALQIHAQMQIEAETVIVNREATNQETLLPDKWCIWSTDVNKKAWSGGVVVRSPITKADHKTHDEGAPVLHIRLPIPEPGVYSIEMHGSGRIIGLSLDEGKTWQRFTSGIMVSCVHIDNGFFDCWFDDCYFTPPPQSLGPAYIDYFLITKLEDVRNGLSNPDFEVGKIGGAATGWSWFHRDRVGSATVSDEHKEGKQALHIVSPDGRDWNVTNAMLYPVKSGGEYIFRCWMKGSVVNMARLELVGYKNGQRVAWTVARSRNFFLSPDKWQPIRAFFQPEDDVDAVMLRIVGNRAADLYVDCVALEEGKTDGLKPRPLVEGHAKTKVVEKFSRGVVAQETDGGVYVSWRLLKEDSKDAAFDVFRKVDGKETKLNASPIVQTCDFMDASPVDNATYVIREVNGGKSGESSVWRRDAKGKLAYKSYKLSDPNARIQKVGFGDLNGDGDYDFVVKIPSGNIDPWNVVWTKSPDTYKLEAFLSDGTRLWTYDLGWDIERGIWYSPYCVQDLDGDGKAEVITKVSDGDHREADGHVYSGDEYFVVLDGMTGKEIDRAPWIRRNHFGSEGEAAYHFSARNLMCIAYLDGKTPCVCILRGTYDDMAVETWQLVNGKLQRVWSYDNAELPRRWYGQGAHTNYALDVDGDGRDEIVLGSAVIDDNGTPLWSIGKGHPDGVFFGKLMPDKPGLQVAWILETAQKKGGLCMADAKTGKLYWELDEPTHHVDGKGQIADIDPLYPGAEIAGADMHILEPGTNKRGLVKGWLMTADGRTLENTETPTYRFGRWTIYWDADLQKEIFGGKITDHNGGPVSDHSFGGMVLIADIIGDWREEIIASPINGEFRIYSTDLPAMDRRPCFMQEHNYRMRMAANAMGYATEALPPYDLESESHNLNGTFIDGKDKGGNEIQLVVVASRHEPLKGTVAMQLPASVTCDTMSFDVDLKPGERMVKRIKLLSDKRFHGPVRFVLTRPDGRQLKGQVLIQIAANGMPKGYFAEAEAFTAQNGGDVHIRDDKPGVHGKAISHWDDKGLSLTWEVSVPTDGNYVFAACYCNPNGARRRLTIDGRDIGVFTFAGSGGFGETPYEWTLFTVNRDNGKPYVFPLKAGKHVVQLENMDGKGMNLDYVGFMKEEDLGK